MRSTERGGAKRVSATSPRELAARAQQACTAGRCEAAIGLLERALYSQPSNVSLYQSLGLCYSGACGARHPLVSPELAVPYLRRAFSLTGDGQDVARANILDALGTATVRCQDGTSAGAIAEAVGCYRAASDLYRKTRLTEDLGRVLFNLGNSLCDLSEASGEDHWGEAVRQYEDALRVRTREKDAARHAAVLENLGSAYRHLSTAEPGRNIPKTIRCYQRALRIFTAAQYPEKHAALHNNLGNAYLSLPLGDAKAAAHNATRALRHFEQALLLQDRETAARAYGITQFNRAQAYSRLADATDGGSRLAAMECLEEAEAAFQRCGEERYQGVIREQLARIRGC